jgi:hypothetical protein
MALLSGLSVLGDGRLLDSRSMAHVFSEQLTKQGYRDVFAILVSFAVIVMVSAYRRASECRGQLGYPARKLLCK